jgi:hypothetical protein
LRQKSTTKVKLLKFAQEIDTVDGGGYPRIYPSAKETSVIDKKLKLFKTDLGPNVINFE